MQEREEFLLREEKASLTARKLQVSLDRADAFIEGGSLFSVGLFLVGAPAPLRPFYYQQVALDGMRRGYSGMFPGFSPQQLCCVEGITCSGQRTA
jgi:hypothetical protein